MNTLNSIAYFNVADRHLRSAAFQEIDGTAKHTCLGGLGRIEPTFGVVVLHLAQGYHKAGTAWSLIIPTGV